MAFTSGSCIRTPARLRKLELYGYYIGIHFFMEFETFPRAEEEALVLIPSQERRVAYLSPLL
jgi:hypothetical protein